MLQNIPHSRKFIFLVNYFASLKVTHKFLVMHGMAWQTLFVCSPNNLVFPRSLYVQCFCSQCVVTLMQFVVQLVHSMASFGVLYNSEVMKPLNILITSVIAWKSCMMHCMQKSLTLIIQAPRFRKFRYSSWYLACMVPNAEGRGKGVPGACPLRITNEYLCYTVLRETADSSHVEDASRQPGSVWTRKRCK